MRIILIPLHGNITHCVTQILKKKKMKQNWRMVLMAISVRMRIIIWKTSWQNFSPLHPTSQSHIHLSSAGFLAYLHCWWLGNQQLLSLLEFPQLPTNVTSHKWELAIFPQRSQVWSLPVQHRKTNLSKNNLSQNPFHLLHLLHFLLIPFLRSLPHLLHLCLALLQDLRTDFLLNLMNCLMRNWKLQCSHFPEENNVNRWIMNVNLSQPDCSYSFRFRFMNRFDTWPTK